jgi:hypothetical protein
LTGSAGRSPISRRAQPRQQSARKLEDLPSDGGAAVDTLAGGLLRAFVKISELESALDRVTRRVGALEGGAAPPKAGNGAT